MKKGMELMQIRADEIGFDLDGVIADTGEAFVRLACTRYEYCNFSLDDISRFDVEDCIKIPQDIIDAIFLEIQEDSIKAGLKPFMGAVEVINDLAVVGQINVITARPLLQPVLDWFIHCFPDSTCRNIDVIATGSPDEKLHHIRKKGLKYFVDDRAATCLELAREGIVPLVYSQPWNVDQHNLQTVANWQELRKTLVL